MAKLNQIIAARNGKKTIAEKTFTKLYQELKKADLFHGISREYEPFDEDPNAFAGDRFPAEKKNVQRRVTDQVKEVVKVLSDYFDLTATQDTANCESKSNVVVDGNIVISDVPVTHLLFLEKALTDLHTFVSKLPTLDTAKDWEWNDGNRLYQTPESFRMKTKKVPRAFKLANATEQHPEQVEVVHEDVQIGKWKQVEFSGEISYAKRETMQDRIRQLLDAVKFAREEANQHEIKDVNVAEPVFNFIFSGLED